MLSTACNWHGQHPAGSYRRRLKTDEAKGWSPRPGWACAISAQAPVSTLGATAPVRRTWFTTSENSEIQIRGGELQETGMSAQLRPVSWLAASAR
jgi:hypothetical protein